MNNNNTKTIIVLLTVTAAILGAILVGSYTAGPAYADSSIMGGDYLMGAMNWKTDVQLVYIIDMNVNRLTTYRIGQQNVGGPLTLGVNEQAPIDLYKVFPEKPGNK